MNLEDLHNELNEFPEDLNYSDAKWQGALELIEAHEAKVANRKKAAGLVCSVILVCCAFMFYPFGVATHSEYTPREWENGSAEVQELQKDEVNSAESARITSDLITEAESTAELDQTMTSETSTNSKNEEAILAETLDAEPNAQGQVTNPINEASGSSDLNSADNSLANLSASEIDETEANPKPTLNEVSNTENAPEQSKLSVKNSGAEPLPKVEPAALVIAQMEEDGSSLLDSNNPGGKTIFNKETTPTLNEMPTRTGLLNFKVFGKKLVSNKIALDGDKTFKIYREYIGGKVGANPLADYGRFQFLGGVNPSLGVFYERSITDKFFWNAGVEYFSLNAIDLSVSSENTTYNYGFESNVLIVNTDRAHFLSMPVYVGFRPIKRVQFKTGFSANVLLETQNTLEEHNISNKESNVLSQTKTSGYRTSFNSLGFTGSAALNYWISERTSIQFTYHLGVSDFSNNQAFGNDNRDRNTRFELSINKVLR